MREGQERKSKKRPLLFSSRRRRPRSCTCRRHHRPPAPPFPHQPRSRPAGGTYVLYANHVRELRRGRAPRQERHDGMWAEFDSGRRRATVGLARCGTSARRPSTGARGGRGCNGFMVDSRGVLATSGTVMFVVLAYERSHRLGGRQGSVMFCHQWGRGHPVSRRSSPR